MEKNSIYFHSGDFKPRNSFTSFPCKHMDVFVNGLEENRVYLEDINGFRIYRDGQVFLCTENTNFTVYSIDNNTYIGTMKIEWNTNCVIQTEPYIQKEEVTQVSLATETGLITSNSTNSYLIKEEKAIAETIISEDYKITNSTSLIQNIEIKHLPIGINEDENLMKSNISFLPFLLIIIFCCFVLIRTFMNGGK